MSRFLGPIHHWLFHKIKLYEQLEAQIVSNFEKEYGQEILSMFSEFSNDIGNPMENKPLEDLIDTNNIHGWLQNKIIIAETRQAALITKAIAQYGEKALSIVKEAYKNQAIESGKDAQANSEVSSAPQIYKALNNYILDGMPCDNVNNITVNEPERLEWKVLDCLHKGYWEKVDGDTNLLYELRKIWISNFVSNANPEFKYSFNMESINGKIVLVHEIKK